jgi:hypothetical protein
MDDQLQQLINLQREQNELLKKHLWRLRFSLLSLLLLTTATAIGLGVVVWQLPTRFSAPTAPGATIRWVQPVPGAPLRPAITAPAGDINVDPSVPTTG